MYMHRSCGDICFHWNFSGVNMHTTCRKYFWEWNCSGVYFLTWKWSENDHFLTQNVFFQVYLHVKSYSTLPVVSFYQWFETTGGVDLIDTLHSKQSCREVISIKWFVYTWVYLITKKSTEVSSWRFFVRMTVWWPQ